MTKAERDKLEEEFQKTVTQFDEIRIRRQIKSMLANIKNDQKKLKKQTNSEEAKKEAEKADEFVEQTMSNNKWSDQKKLETLANIRFKLLQLFKDEAV